MKREALGRPNKLGALIENSEDAFSAEEEADTRNLMGILVRF